MLHDFQDSRFTAFDKSWINQEEDEIQLKLIKYHIAIYLNLHEQ